MTLSRVTQCPVIGINHATITTDINQYHHLLSAVGGIARTVATSIYVTYVRMGQTLQKMAKIKLEMGKITDLNCSGMGWLMLFLRLMLKENPMYVNHNKQVECV